MPLRTKKAGDYRGTEANGVWSEKWCSQCYERGMFLNPDYRLEQMIKTVDKELKEGGRHALFRWLAKQGIPSLERWKKND
jgi:Putative zinc ribbon domain